jgi:hypothetical protein
MGGWKIWRSNANQNRQNRFSKNKSTPQRKRRVMGVVVSFVFLIRLSVARAWRPTRENHHENVGWRIWEKCSFCHAGHAGFSNPKPPRMARMCFITAPLP